MRNRRFKGFGFRMGLRPSLPIGFLFLSFMAVLLSGCGAGIVGAIIAGQAIAGKGNGGEANSPALVSGVSLLNARKSPATVNFVLSDAEGDPADVEVEFAAEPSSDERPANRGLIARLPSLSTSPGGNRHTVPWDFEEDLGRGFRSGISVTVTIQGGQASLLPAQEIGNDAPQVFDVQVPAVEKVVGIAKINFRVRDSSGDPVTVTAEYHLPGVDPEGENWTWHPARPAAAAIRGVRAPPEGTEFTFFWDVVQDLHTLDREVVLRFTAEDENQARSAQVVSDPFRVDNNERPLAALLARQFVQGRDRRRGIPVPFMLQDSNSDPIRPVFQWRLASQADFPALPAKSVDLEAILRDPIERRGRQIAIEKPLMFEGRAVAVSRADDPPQVPGTSVVRLPEVASNAATLLARGMEGREIEILRSSTIPETTGLKWALAAPVAAVPLSDGIHALVLDRPGAGSWRLRELDLGSGETASEVAFGAEGEPTALAFEPRSTVAVVAADRAGEWKVLRVALKDGSASTVAARPALSEPGPVRSLAFLGTGTVLATVGSSLVRLDLSQAGASSPVALLSGLKTPWGVVVDPLRPNGIYLAQRDADGPGGVVGLVEAIALDTLERRPVPLRPGAAGPFLMRPESIVLERKGTRLLAVTAAGAEGFRRIVGVDLDGNARGAPFEVTSGLPGPVGSLAAGPDHLRILPLPLQNDLAVGGGVRARRRIVSFETIRKEATVDQAFSPPVTNLERWRIVDRAGVIASTPEGRRASFVWDSEDVAQGGEVVLRLVPYDSEVGVPSDSVIPRPVDGRYEIDLRAAVDTPQGVIAADLDGDGRPDLIAAGAAGITVLYQERLRSFKTPERIPGHPGSSRAVAAADVDGDGLLDLISARGDSLTVFRQTGPRVFQDPPLELKHDDLRGPRSVAAADLDRDGFLDLVSANFDGNTLTVFYQRMRGFESTEVATVKDTRQTLGPVAAVPADLDGDGLPDLVSVDQRGGNLAIFHQDPAGGFSKRAVLGGLAAPAAAAAADLDGDGDLDLAAAEGNGGALRIFLQEAAGDFAGGTALTGLDGPAWVAAADLDGDGDLDLAAAASGSRRLVIFHQERPGVFPAVTSLGLASSDPLDAPVAAAIADLDNDGSLDLAAVNFPGNSLAVFHRIGAGDFGTGPERRPDLVIAPGEEMKAPNWIQAADLDGDGDFDLLIANYTSGNVAVIFQEQPGSFAPSPLYLKDPGLPRPLIVGAADLDGDGLLDIICTSSAPGTEHRNIGVYLQERSKPGSFRKDPFIFWDGRIDSPGPIVAADLNGDGFLDLVAGSGLYLGLYRSDGAGPGSFSASMDTLALPRGGFWDVAVADLDRDGVPDIASAVGDGLDTQKGNLIVFLQRQGRFPKTPDIRLGGHSVALSLLAVDLDRDGGEDLVTAIDSGRTEIYLQRREGGFDDAPARQIEGAPVSPSTHAAGDFDGDGDLDLAVARNLSSKGVLALYFQGGGLSLAPEPDVSLEAPPALWPVVALDIDGDGDLDLVSVHLSEDLATVFFGGRR